MKYVSMSKELKIKKDDPATEVYMSPRLDKTGCLGKVSRCMAIYDENPPQIFFSALTHYSAERMPTLFFEERRTC